MPTDAFMEASPAHIPSGSTPSFDSRSRTWVARLVFAGILAAGFLVVACDFQEPDRAVVRAYQKINEVEGGFTGSLIDNEVFGRWIAPIGDLDGDGTPDIAVGAFKHPGGGPDRGAVYLLFLNPDGTVREHRTISDTEGGFTGGLEDGDRFGTSVVSVGDLDGDGIPDLAVGAALHAGRGIRRGSVWILFMNEDGTVKGHQRIGEEEGGFDDPLVDEAVFGIALAPLGDLDGDGVPDLAVGARRYGDQGDYHGAVWILFMNEDGTVREHQKISRDEGGLHGLPPGTEFGQSMAVLHDLDPAGRPALAVGAFRDRDGGPDRGAVWILFLNEDGTVRTQQKISAVEGGFRGRLRDGDLFGSGIAPLGPLDTGAYGLAVGARRDDGRGTDRGAIWLLALNPDGTVGGHSKIGDRRGNFDGTLHDDDQFGYSLAAIGDVDGSGLTELATGAIFDDGPGENRGALWVLFLNSDDLMPE